MKLGCIESENVELRVQIEDRSYANESRFDSSRLIVEQDLEVALRQVAELTEALA